MTPVLRADGIAKSFGATKALDGVSFDARAGEIHAIVGQNGAGKSTLMGVLAGKVQPDGGDLFLDGEAVRMSSPRHAIACGVSIVPQHRHVVPDLTVAENIYLGRLPRTRLRLVDWPRLFQDAGDLVERLGFDLDVRKRTGLLRPAGRQLTEIARALAGSAKVLILDEPSAVLSRGELDSLFTILRSLRARGVTILYVSHHLAEISEIADRVTVLRDGKTVATSEVRPGMDVRFLIEQMIGGEWKEPAGRPTQTGSSMALDVDRLHRAGSFEDVSFAIRGGEILGLAGLVGSGAREVCRAIFGASPYDGGSVCVNGDPGITRSPHEARRRGIAYLSEDRTGEGLIGELPVSANITLSALSRFVSGGVLNLGAETEWARRMTSRLGVRCARVEARPGSLSGGNQQKVLLGKWLSTDARIYLLDHPTAGVDIAAKAEIHRLLRELATNGAALLVLSSDLGELLTVCDRILIMRKGRIVREVRSASTTEKEILYYANAEGGL